MPLFGPKKEAEVTPVADENAPATRAEFSALDARLAQLAGSIEQLASRPVVVQAAAPVAVAAAPDASDEEIDSAIAEGKGAGHIKRLIARRLDEARREVSAELGAVRDYGTTMLGSVAERAFVAGLTEADRGLFRRFEQDVRGLVGQCEPALRGHPETWETAFSAILGQPSHRMTLETERVEAELRRRDAVTAAANAPQPGRSGSPRGMDADDAIPTLVELAGDFPHLGDMSEAEFVKKMNRGKPKAQHYKDWADYIERGRQIEKSLLALRDGSDDGGEGALPGSLH